MATADFTKNEEGFIVNLYKQCSMETGGSGCRRFNEELSDLVEKKTKDPEERKKLYARVRAILDARLGKVVE